MYAQQYLTGHIHQNTSVQCDICSPKYTHWNMDLAESWPFHKSIVHPAVFGDGMHACE